MDKKRLLLVLLLILLSFQTACAADENTSGSGAGTVTITEPEETEEEKEETTMIYAKIGDSVLEIQPEENSSADAFLALLQEGDVTVSMHDYGNFEKVGDLPFELVIED